MSRSRPFHLSLLAGMLPLVVSPLRGADFIVGIEGVPETLGGAPGELLVFDAFVTLTTTNAESEDGAQGWTLVVRVEGGEILKISDAGLEVRTLLDHDGDPATPPLYPHAFRLEDADFNKSGIYNVKTEDGPKPSGAILAMVLGFVKRTELDPRGTQRIARLTVAARVPEDAGCAPVRVEVLEGDTPMHLGAAAPPERRSIWGVPIESLITYKGESRRPSRVPASGLACVQPFRRGDTNDDVRVDISDAIALLGFLFLDAGAPTCLDAVDANDDGRVDISDVIFTLDDLFGPFSGTRIPAPGPFACGFDPTPDQLGCAGARTCPAP